MSLHPLSPEMLVGECVVAAGAIAGGFALSSRGHPALAVVAWAFAALILGSIAVTAVAERDAYPPGQVLRRLVTPLLSVGYLAGLGYGTLALYRTGHAFAAVLAALAGLFAVPVGLVYLAVALEERRARTRDE